VNCKEDVLNDIFCLRLIPKNLERQPQNRPEETDKEQVETILATVRDVVKQCFIGQQSDMLVSCHFAADYKRAPRARQGLVE
jgi:hypothetical protein